jgi:hypothetical protein
MNVMFLEVSVVLESPPPPGMGIAGNVKIKNAWSSASIVSAYFTV